MLKPISQYPGNICLSKNFGASRGRCAHGCYHHDYSFLANTFYQYHRKCQRYYFILEARGCISTAAPTLHKQKRGFNLSAEVKFKNPFSRLIALYTVQYLVICIIEGVERINVEFQNHSKLFGRLKFTIPLRLPFFF